MQHYPMAPQGSKVKNIQDYEYVIISEDGGSKSKDLNIKDYINIIRRRKDMTVKECRKCRIINTLYDDQITKFAESIGNSHGDDDEDLKIVFKFWDLSLDDDLNTLKFEKLSYKQVENINFYKDGDENKEKKHVFNY